MAKRRYFGNVRQLPSGRYQARYAGPDGRTHHAAKTFDRERDADRWLADRRSEITAGTWLPEAPEADAGADTFAAYAAGWLRDRDLKPRVRIEYERILTGKLLPTFGAARLADISSRSVRAWYATLDPKKPTARAHAYSLLRTILQTAVMDEMLEVNPCKIRGAGTTRRAREIEPATLEELAIATEAMPERLRAAVPLTAWCALRFGEMAELRRADVDLRRGVVHVRRAVTQAAGERWVGDPKSAAGTRTVAVPPHLVPMLREHLAEHVGRSRDALLFPAADGRSNLAASSLYSHWRKARKAAGRPYLRWHDLRHTGAVLAASTGATLAELMARLGHSSPGAALRYQHASRGRDRQIAEALSALIGGEGQP